MRNPEEDDDDEEVVKFDEAQYPARKRLDNMSPVFLSKSKRPRLMNEHSPLNLGPGTYSTETAHGDKFDKEKGILSAMHYRVNPQQAIKHELLSKIKPPGPGTYGIEKKASIESLLTSPHQSNLPKEDRFKKIAKVTSVQIPSDSNRHPAPDSTTNTASS